MQVVASQPSSVVEVSLEPGDELVESIKRALADGGYDNAFVVGSGEIEDAEVLSLSASGGARIHRKLAGACDLIALSGNFGEAGLELRASLSRETESGASTVGGLLIKATVVSVELRALVRAPQAGAALRRSVPSAAAPAPPSVPAAPAPPRAEPSAPTIPILAPTPVREVEAPRPPSPSTPSSGVPLPPKLRRVESAEIYPEERDVVTHFAFGRCVVTFSDGERIRLQQEPEGRVREVALSMLRIETPTILEDGRKHWELSRKN